MINTKSPASFYDSTKLFLGRIVSLAIPYGFPKLIKVFAFSLCQGFFQILGVSSIFPFLALVADTDHFRSSAAGIRLLSPLPTMDDASLIWWAGLLAVVSLFISNFVNIAAEFNRSSYAFGFAHWLRVRLLRGIAGRGYASFLSGNSSYLIQKVNVDVTQYASGVLLPVLDCIGNFATAALIFTALVCFNPQVALGSVAIFGLYYLIAFATLTSKRRAISQGLHLAGRGATQALHQLMDGIKPIKVHLAEDPWLNRFAEFSRREALLAARLPLYQNGPRYLMELLAFGGLVLAILISVRGGHTFMMIMPNLGVVALAGYRLLPSIQIIYSKLTHISTMRHSMDEIYEEFTALERMPDDECPADNRPFTRPPTITWNREIRLERLSFQYPGTNQPIIENLSVHIPKNSSLGITGPSGCGKSSLVDLILGLQSPSSGRIFCDSQILDAKTRRAWCRGIGYVPQEIFLIDDTVAANIAFGVPLEQVDYPSLRRAAELARILRFIEDELPDGFQHLVGERGVRLSGGQRQRIGLARALYHQPSLLIFDEATSALDFQTEGEVIQALRAIHGTVTLIMITHRLSTLELCDQVLDLSKRNRPH